MEIYAANADVTVAVDLIDRSGQLVVPLEASYVVTDEVGVELASGTIPIAGGEEVVEVVVPAAANALASGRAARAVTVAAVTATGTVALVKTYAIEVAGTLLAIPAASGQTLAQAALLGLARPDLMAWADAADHAREAALAEAWARLSRLAYRPWREHDDKTLAASATPLLLDGRFRLNELDPADWAALPQPFRTALCRAQLVEANVLLDGDPVWDRRVDGLLSKTVGESSEFFRSGKPLVTAVSQKAMRELSGYLVSTARIGRG